MAMGRNGFSYSTSEPVYYKSSPEHGYSQRVRIVELLVPMCCIKCEEKIQENMLELDGVHRVVVDMPTGHVTVTGLIDPMQALKKAKKVKKDSQVWSSGLASSYAKSRHLQAPIPAPIPAHRTSHRNEFTRAQPLTSYSEYPRPQPVYRTSYSQHRPASYGHPGYMHDIRHSRSIYHDDGYSPVITNPHYIKHIQGVEF